MIDIDGCGLLHKIKGKDAHDFTNNPEVFEYGDETSYRFILGYN